MVQHVSTVSTNPLRQLPAVIRSVKRGDYSVEQYLLLRPLVLTADLILLLGREVVLDIESLADLLRRLALDHVGNGLAANVKKRLDVQIVGRLQGLVRHIRGQQRRGNNG